MAHAHADTYAQDLVVSADDAAVKISCGPFSFYLYRREAAQLAADLLNAVEATPAAQQVPA